ncbi:MAG: DNA polymerase IV [Elusimicrobiaceae bacterium]|nr:DNA polymerase IV [Elusimicrobiaceae bacterium]
MIAHIDMDAFFAAIEQRDNPALKGKPVIIGADPKNGAGRGVVSTASYEARAYGIRSAMPISQAYRICPAGIFLPPDMAKYGAVSRQIQAILGEFTPSVEQVSVDEAFMDLAGLEKLFGRPEEICRKIKARIKAATGLTASIGLAPVKSAAKIASDMNKPDGLTVVPPGQLRQFLAPLDIAKLWGLGAKSKEILNRAGIFTVAQLAARKPSTIERLLGRNGLFLLELANGIDGRRVEPGGAVKSVSNEITFETDTADETAIHAALSLLAEKVSHRLRRKGLKGSTLGIKIRFDDFTTFTRAKTLSEPTNFENAILSGAAEQFGKFLPLTRPVRLIGIRVSNFPVQPQAPCLFPDAQAEKNEKLHRAVDSIRLQFGFRSVRRAGSRKTDGE